MKGKMNDLLSRDIGAQVLNDLFATTRVSENGRFPRVLSTWLSAS